MLSLNIWQYNRSLIKVGHVESLHQSKLSTLINNERTYDYLIDAFSVQEYQGQG